MTIILQKKENGYFLKCMYWCAPHPVVLQLCEREVLVVLGQRIDGFDGVGLAEQ